MMEIAERKTEKERESFGAKVRKRKRRSASPGRGSRDGAWRAKLAARRDLRRRDEYIARGRKKVVVVGLIAPRRGSPRARHGRLLLLDADRFQRLHRNSHARKRRGGGGEGKRERNSPLLWPCSDGRICDVASNSVNRSRQ